MNIVKAKEDFIRYKKLNCPVAAQYYSTWLDRLCQFLGQGREVEDIDITELVNWLENQKRRYEEGTVHQMKVALRGLLKYSEDEDLDCVSHKRISCRSVSYNSHHALTFDEFQEIRQLTLDNDYYNIVNRLIIDLLCDTGMRVSELSEIKMAQMDIDRRKAVIETKKNNDMRQVFWSERTDDTLSKYMPVRKKLGRNDRLLLGRNSRTGKVYDQLSTRSIQNRIKKLREESDINKQITPHSFRHGRAHQWRKQGASLPFIKEALGHQAIESTQIYQKYEDKEFEREAKGYIGAES